MVTHSGNRGVSREKMSLAPKVLDYDIQFDGSLDPSANNTLNFAGALQISDGVALTILGQAQWTG